MDNIKRMQKQIAALKLENAKLVAYGRKQAKNYASAYDEIILRRNSIKAAAIREAASLAPANNDSQDVIIRFLESYAEDLLKNEGGEK